MSLDQIEHCEGESASLPGEPGPPPGDGEVLAGETAGPEGGGSSTAGGEAIPIPDPTRSGPTVSSNVCFQLPPVELNDVAEVGDSRPPGGEDCAGIGVNLRE